MLILCIDLVVFACVGPAVAASEPSCPITGSAVVLTVAGAVANPNRGGNTPLDQFASHQDLKFDRARGFTADDLAALPMRTLRMVLPYDHQPHVFTGPALDQVLKAAGATGGIVAHGIDGYRVEFSAADLAQRHPILSLCGDGMPLGLGGLGPGFVVYAPASGDVPSDEEFARMIWGVYLIEAQ